MIGIENVAVVHDKEKKEGPKKNIMIHDSCFTYTELAKKNYTRRYCKLLVGAQINFSLLSSNGRFVLG